MSNQADGAISIIQTHGIQTVEILSKLLSSDKVSFIDFEKYLDSEDDREKIDRQRKDSEGRKPDFIERITAVYALAHLAEDYPEVQEILVAKLSPPSEPSRGSFSEAVELQENLIRALGYVKGAKQGLVAALLDPAIKRNLDVDWSITTIGRLQNPREEAVSLLIQKYPELNDKGRESVIKSLGTVEPPTPQIINLLLSALKDKDHGVAKAAATVLVHLSDPEARIVDALVDYVGYIPATVEIAGKLVAHFASSRDVRRQTQLAKIVKELRTTLYRQSLYSEDSVYEAFKRAMDQLTIVTANKTLPADLQLLEKDEPVVVSQSRKQSSITVILGILASFVLGVASNVAATYFQERYQLISDPVRIVIVGVVMLVSLIAVIILGLRSNRES